MKVEGLIGLIAKDLPMNDRFKCVSYNFPISRNNSNNSDYSTDGEDLNNEVTYDLKNKPYKYYFKFKDLDSIKGTRNITIKAKRIYEIEIN